MNVGLLYTPVSIYQMTRGSLVLFVGCLSVVFLHRRLWLYQYVNFDPSNCIVNHSTFTFSLPRWLSLLVVVAGVAVVGLSGSLAKKAVPADGRGLLASLAAEEPESVRVVVGAHARAGVLRLY